MAAADEPAHRQDGTRPPAQLHTLHRLGRDPGLAMLAYLGLSLAVTWPLARDFTTALTGVGDARHQLWALWHTKEALAGREPFFYTSLLYYPIGIPLTGHSLGPLAGLFALPFWPLGPEAAYNGTLLVGFWLTGCCMYWLAQGLGLGRGVSFFAGTLLLIAPRHTVTAAAGHLEKTFLGWLPLTLLALHHALDLNRSPWWTAATGLMLLAALLHSSEQFLFAAVAVGFLMLMALLTGQRAERWPKFRRSLLVGGSALILCGPVLALVLSTATNPAITVDRYLESFRHQPDLIQFFLPDALTSRWLGPLFTGFLNPYVQARQETSVFLSWPGLILCLVALWRGPNEAKTWGALTALFVVLSLGPELLILGQNRFTRYELPVILPYALVTSLPGLGFLRSPARFMLMGYVGLGIAAGLGLQWVLAHLDRRFHLPVLALAVALVLFENWPLSPPQEKLRPVPRFYQQIAHDRELYGVFDLPIRPFRRLDYSSSCIVYSSYYQMYQMTHRKGIASGYLSRTYDRHPVFGDLIENSTRSRTAQPDLLVNGRPANPYAGVEYELARNHYRYVVFHKPRSEYREYKPGSWGERTAREFVEGVFAGRAPLVDDELVTVYAVRPLTDTALLTVTMALGDGWWPEIEGAAETGATWRWAESPAQLRIYSPVSQTAQLEIVPALLYDPDEANLLGEEGTIQITVNDGVAQKFPVRVGEPLVVDLSLRPGRNTVTLAWPAGNFRPSEVWPESQDQRRLSFAVSRIDLMTRLGGGSP